MPPFDSPQSRSAYVGMYDDQISGFDEAINDTTEAEDTAEHTRADVECALVKGGTNLALHALAIRELEGASVREIRRGLNEISIVGNRKRLVEFLEGLPRTYEVVDESPDEAGSEAADAA